MIEMVFDCSRLFFRCMLMILDMTAVVWYLDFEMGDILMT
jgi:hypothetical protein